MATDGRRRAEAFGRTAELRAQLFFLLRGFWPIAWRYKTPVGEIDLVLVRGRTLVFAEVKARRGDAADDVTLSVINWRRIERAARHFLAVRGEYAPYTLRFDVILVDGAWRVRHRAHAWAPEIARE